MPSIICFPVTLFLLYSIVLVCVERVKGGMKFALSKVMQEYFTKAKGFSPLLSHYSCRIKVITFCTRYCQASALSQYSNQRERITNEFHEKIELLRKIIF